MENLAEGQSAQQCSGLYGTVGSCSANCKPLEVWYKNFTLRKNSKHYVLWISGTTHHLLIPSLQWVMVVAASCYGALPNQIQRGPCCPKTGVTLFSFSTFSTTVTWSKQPRQCRSCFLIGVEWSNQSSDLKSINHLCRDLVAIHRCFPSNMMEL